MDEQANTDFIKCPCDDCTAEHKLIDEWGYFCDLVCGKRSHWISRCRGHQDMLEVGYRLPEQPDKREAVAYIRDAILAINSYTAYECLGLEDSYSTPAESYVAEGLEEAEDVVDQILTLTEPKVLSSDKQYGIANWGNPKPQ